MAKRMPAGFRRSSPGSKYAVFVPSSDLDRKVAATPQARAGLQQVTGAGERDTKRIVRAEAYDTGRLHDSTRGGVTLERGRWVGYVSMGNAKAWYAAIVEFHPLNGRVRAPLRRGVEGKGRWVDRRNVGRSYRNPKGQ